VFSFPAKRLRKNTGAQNTHAPVFLKKKFAVVAVNNICLKIYFSRQKT